MAEQPQRLRLEQIDWSEVLPWLCLFRSFRMAIAPPKILLGMALVILTFVYARTLDVVGGGTVYPGEIRATAAMDAQAYEDWRASRERLTAVELRKLLKHLSSEETGEIVKDDDRFERVRGELIAEFGDNSDLSVKLSKLKGLEPLGVFEATMMFKLNAFDRLVRAAASLNFGFAEISRFAGSSVRRSDTVVGALHDTCIVLPRWLRRAHPWYLGIYMIGAAALFAVFGGALCRLAALDAAGAMQSSTTASLRFAVSRFLWFFLSPLFPVILAVVLMVLMLLGGLVFFNIPGLDIIGSLAFFLFLLAGAAAAMLLILLVVGGHLLYPAVAVEDADMFDAVSRALGYVLARPWRWLFYTIVSLVYGALTYLFLMLVVSLTLGVTQWAVSAGVLRESNGVNLFDLILPPREWGELLHTVTDQPIGWTARLAAWLVWFWTALLIAALWSYVISFYFTANTWIYLLLRRAVDGNGLEDIFEEPQEPAVPPSPAETSEGNA